MEPSESCGKLPLLARVAVEQPSLLARAPWREHLLSCPDCRAEAAAQARALAVFRHVEAARLAEGVPEGPGWEQVAAVLGRAPGSRRRMRRPAVAAVAAGMMLFSGAVAWDMLMSDDPPSARVVALGPEQQERMRELILQSLGAGHPVSRRAPAQPIASEEVALTPRGLYASGDSAVPRGPFSALSHPALPAEAEAPASPFLGLPRPVPVTPVGFAGAGPDSR